MRQPDKSTVARSSGSSAAHARHTPATTPTPSAATPPDERLERAARQFTATHEEASFTVLYSATQGAFLRFVCAQGLRECDADDVVSQTGVALWAARATFTGAYKDFVAYGIGIARVQIQSWRRREGRHCRDVRRAAETGTCCAGPLDADDAASLEDLLKLRESLGTLPLREQDVLRRRAEGCTWGEIAQELGVTSQRAQQIHAKAAKMLRKGM